MGSGAEGPSTDCSRLPEGDRRDRSRRDRSRGEALSGIELTIAHDDKSWVLRHSDLTAIDERACRKATGFTIAEIMGFVADTKSGLDTLAALEWVARRQNGEALLTFEEVAREMSVSSAITVDWNIGGGDPDPE